MTSSVYAQIGLDRVHVPGDAPKVGGDAECRLVANWQVGPDLGGAAESASIHTSEAELGKAFRDPEFWLIGDVANGPGQRAGSEQRSLWSPQHLDTTGVEQIDIRREERQRHDRLVEVDTDLFLHAGLVAHDLAGRDTAHRDLALARPEILNRQPDHVHGHVFDIFDAANPQHFFGRRRNRERHVEQRLLALRRGDSDLLGQRRIEREIERLHCSGRHLERLRDSSKACQFNRHGVRAWRQGERVGAISGGRRRTGGLGGLIRGGDGGSWKGRTGGVAHDAGDLRFRLRCDVSGGDESDDGECGKERQPINHVVRPPLTRSLIRVGAEDCQARA